MGRHPHFKAYAALVSVCFFWGTTYLAIRIALEAFPPLWLVALRFVASGSLMLAGAFLSGAHLPRGRELLVTAFLGVLILGIGNGCLVFAEQWIPSGLAALIITISPFWMVGLESLVPGGDRLHLPAVFGLVVGCAGAALLVGPDVWRHDAGGNVTRGFLTLQAGSAFWSLGSILQRRHPTKAHSIVSGAIQQLAAGLVFVPGALLLPEHPIAWSFRGTAAIVYLILFGSIVGYSSYIYALERLPIAIASVYSYINPLVAVILGWLFFREPFGKNEAIAMVVIFAGVTIVKRSSRAERRGA